MVAYRIVGIINNWFETKHKFIFISFAIYELVLFSFHMQCVFKQDWLNANWTHVSSSHTTDWILSKPSVVFTHDWILTEPTLPALSCPLYHKGQQLYECTCMAMSSRNLYKCKQVVYCVFCFRLSIQSCCCMFICLSVILYCTLLLLVYFIFFILMLLLYFCLLINHVNRPIIFIFGALVYYF